MQLNPYLNFNGQCDEALKFYESVLGGKITFKQTWGDSPMAKHVPPETHQSILHSTMDVGGSTLMCADSPPDSYAEPKGIQVALHFKDTAEGERIFKALSEGGRIDMPFQATFWSPGFGMCADRFGIPWMVNCEGPTG
ncbi:MAG TPA: VOC family protein [Pyrinomonadaceae bacterium]|nr:VOC family protein [Pyrinomonadaceae bacterium]